MQCSIKDPAKMSERELELVIAHLERDLTSGLASSAEIEQLDTCKTYLRVVRHRRQVQQKGPLYAAFAAITLRR